MSDQFQGWLGHDPESAKGNMKWGSFTPKVWEECDVDIEIMHCGICGSDLHTLSSGWEPTPYPCVVGHEIVGKAIRVGNQVKHISVGDRVGVGAQAGACLKDDCDACSAGLENYCYREGSMGTYGEQYPDDKGMSYGGYATHNRTHARFVFKIPEKLSSANAAPMLCAGITVFSPLKHFGCGPGKSVGIVGVGGLGHFGVLFARALGADKVVAVSRRPEKAEDAKALGADVYLASAEKEWTKGHERSLDLIINTISSDKMPIGEYLSLLKIHGTFCQVGAPDLGKMPDISAFSLLNKGIQIAGSGIGSPGQIQEMLEFAAKHDIKPWIQERNMKEANQAIVDMEAGKARYRYVLVN